jgi:hypothetical protein
VTGGPSSREYQDHGSGPRVVTPRGEQIQQQLRDVDELPAGGVRLEIGFLVGPNRYWPNLWKPTIDALDPILGPTRPDRPWHPRDGRIVNLGLHSAIDSTQTNTVRITIRAAPSQQ